MVGGVAARPMADIPPTRASLLVRLRDRQDEAAWRDFVDLYTPVVYGYARKQGLQAADAADLSQEVLGAVVGSVNRLDYDPRRGAFRNWLFTIVRRKLSNWRAAGQKHCGGTGDTAMLQLLEHCPASKPSGRPSGSNIWSPGPVSKSVAMSRTRPGRHSGELPSTASPASASPRTSA
jgi:RNA polymerase sigma factor (sigma-70 family)